MWWTEEDEENYETTWISVPTKSEEVWISSSCTLQGSTEVPNTMPEEQMGSYITERITALPWCVDVCPDGEHLNHLKAGTVDELASAHPRLKPGKTFPSGPPNAYGEIISDYTSHPSP